MGEFTTRQAVSGLILAGGKSVRFGSDKSWAELQGKTLLQWVADALAAVCTEIIVVHAAGQQLPALRAPVPVRCVSDEYDGLGPLAGLISGFPHVSGEYCVASAVDIPLLQPAVVERLAERVKGRDVAVPVVDGYRQPLLAAYRPKTCLVPFRNSLLGGEGRILAAYVGLDVVHVEESELAELDPDLRSFRNANRPAALEELSKLAASR